LSRTSWLAAAVIAVAVAFGAPARAELVRIETVGTVPLGATSRGGAQARQAALEAGVRDAVVRAGGDLASQAGSGASSEAIRAALGGDLLAYASRFRILEDRGERAPLLEQSPDATHEYVVTVEAHIDQARIRSRLAAAGLLGAPLQPGARRPLRIQLEGVDSYPLWERIERALGARGGAVRPLEFSRGRIVAELETEEAGSTVVDRLGAALGEAIEVRSLGVDGDTLLLAIAPRAVAAPALPAEPTIDPAMPPSEPAPTPSAR
jgi:hypothetical protein